MNKKEWHWMDKVSGENHYYNEGKQIIYVRHKCINQGKSPQQMKASYYGAFIGFIGMGILIIGALVWEWIKS